MNCQELLIEQVSMTKAANPNARVFVYRNLVKVNRREAPLSARERRPSPPPLASLASCRLFLGTRQ
jgi:hypothetical protein